MSNQNQNNQRIKEIKEAIKTLEETLAEIKGKLKLIEIEND